MQATCFAHLRKYKNHNTKHVHSPGPDREHANEERDPIPKKHDLLVDRVKEVNYKLYTGESDAYPSAYKMKILIHWN